MFVLFEGPGMQNTLFLGHLKWKGLLKKQRWVFLNVESCVCSGMNSRDCPGLGDFPVVDGEW